MELPVADADIGHWEDAADGDNNTPNSPGDGHERHLGDFELMSEIGRGGIGVVYRAWQPTPDRRQYESELLDKLWPQSGAYDRKGDRPSRRLRS